jgi:RNA polymerase sigma factor (sigma-70 family)
MSLQTEPANPYDTVSSGFLLQSARLTAMDEFRVGEATAADRRPAGSTGVDSTVDLLARAKAGDREATDRLFARCLPALRRWASGRLPRWTRDLMDTDDLVQETVVRAFKRIDSFESRHDGALQAYLRQAVVNRIRDEIRRTKRSPTAVELDENQGDGGRSALDLAIGHEAVERYEAALARLRPEEREAIVARVELDGSYQAVAEALGKPSADAARMAVSRALLRLAAEMNRADV